MDLDRLLSRFSFLIFSVSFFPFVTGVDLTRSNTAGYGKTRSKEMSGMAAPPVGPPVPPIPPIPLMEDPGARMARPPMEPPFGPPGPPNYMGMGVDFGLNPQMPSASGLEGFPSAQLQQDSPPNQYSYPQNSGIPPTRNDDPYAYPYNMPKPAGLYSQGPAENPNPQQLTLGGFPYEKPADHNSYDSFSPVTPPPANNNGEYSYDWSFNSNGNQPISNGLTAANAGTNDDVLTVRDLMASPPPKVMPRQSKPVTKRCVPDDIAGSSGICAARSARRAKCGGLVSSMSKDCDKDELCCFAIRRNGTIISVSVKQSQRQCVSAVAPKNPGFCSAQADRQKNCAGLVASGSPDCPAGQLCCFSATPSLIEIQIVGSTPRPALTAETEETACFPSIKPEVQGICAKRTVRPQRCRGMLSATSNNCHQDELCCFFLNGTSAFKQQISSMQASQYGQGGGGTYYQIPTAPTTTTTTTTTTSRQTVTTPTTTTTYGVTYAPSWNQGATTPYYFPYKPDRLCIPATNSVIYDGTCVAASMIQYLCSGLQASSSLNCGLNEYCCYSNKQTPAPSTPYGNGCVPDNNPNVVDGFCTDANDLSAKCTGISISTSRGCGVTQFCCYSGKNVIVPTPGSYGQQQQSYGMSNNYGYGTPPPPPGPPQKCVPDANKDIGNGSCVAFSQISQQCKGIQISTSLDCGYSQYCCYVHQPVQPPPSRLGCIPENNPTITNGTCIESTDLATYCKGMQISVSLNCPIMSLCCYPLAINTSPPPTITPSPPTTTPYYVTGYQTPSPPPVTYSPSAGGCVPDNNPSVTGGSCVAPSQLTSSCKGIQIAPSRGCPPTYFCCYTSGTTGIVYTPTTPYYTPATPPYVTQTTSTTTTSTTSGLPSRCSPDTAPSANNGKCVDTDQLSTQCKGINIATSRDCPITSLCCFNASDLGVVTGTTASYTYPTPMATTTTMRPTTTSAYYTPAPSPPPTVTPSPPPVTDSYYNNYKPTGSPYVATPAPVANRSCSPQSNRQIKNGFCVSNTDISQKCRGIQISPSLDCLGEEYCCYQSPDVLDVRPGGACIPQSNPKILNGVCVDSDQIGVSCKGVQMSTSRNCKPTQFCCFNTNDAYAWGYGYQTPSQYSSNRQRLPAGSCKPNGRDSDSINGICVETSDIMVACKQWQVARSNDCQSSQYCCFSEDKDVSVRVQRPQQLPNRDAVLLALASNSQNGNYYAPPAITQAPPSYYPAYSDSTPAPPTSPTTSYTPAPTTASTTTRPTSTPAYTPPSITTPTTAPQTPAPSRSCRPMSYPSISNGICVASSQIGQACSGIQVSPSLNCYGSELCCFTSPTLPPPTAAPSACSPETNPEITNGQCVNSDALSSTCAGRQMGNSRNCQIGQLCCFGTNGQPTGSTGSTNPYTPPTVTPTVTVTPMTTYGYTTAPATTTTTTPTTTTTKTTTTTTPSYTPAPTPPPPPPTTAPYYSNNNNDNTGTPATGSTMCIPDSTPIVNNGFCVDQSNLADSCRGIQISTSRQCGIGRFCCFTLKDSTVTVTPTVTPNTPVYTPTSSTTVYTPPPTSPTSSTTTPTTTSTTTTTTSTTPSTVTTAAYTYPTNTPTTSPRTQVCNPQSDTSPSAQQGLCVAAAMISVACNGLQLSTSLQCGFNEYCCYKPTAVVTPSTPSAGYCVPENDLSVNNGFCVNTNQLAQRCAGIEMSTSLNCALDQMCCYNKSAASVSPNKFADVVPKSVDVMSKVTAPCTPISDSSQRGSCVHRSTLPGSCKNKQMSISGDCNSGEFCCFDRSAPRLKTECTPFSDPSQKGSCIQSSQITSTCKNMQMSKSSDCGAREFCCFARNFASKAECVPDSDKAQKGTCALKSNLPTVCKNMQMSMSGDCAAEEFCCFSRLDSRSDVSSQSFCSPDTSPEISNGFCTDPATVATSCQGGEAATSRNCADDQLCCFRRDAVVPAGRDDAGNAESAPAVDDVAAEPVSWPRSL